LVLRSLQWKRYAKYNTFTEFRSVSTNTAELSKEPIRVCSGRCLPEIFQCAGKGERRKEEGKE
jgi:hypothetical protein